MAKKKSDPVRELKFAKGQEALLEAVVRVVAQKGLRGLTFRSLASEAKVSPALAAHHFGTRDALIGEALKYAIVQALESTHLRDVATSEEIYRNALTNSVVTETDLHVFQIEMILEARRRPELQPLIQDLYQTYLESIRINAQSLGLRDASTATYRAIFASLDGLILQYLGGFINIDEFRESTQEMWNLALARS